MLKFIYRFFCFFSLAGMSNSDACTVLFFFYIEKIEKVLVYLHVMFSVKRGGITLF